MSSSDPPPRQLLTPPEESDATSQPPLHPPPHPSSSTSATTQPSTSTASLFDWEVYRAVNNHQTGPSSVLQSNNNERNEIDLVCELSSSSSFSFPALTQSKVIASNVAREWENATPEERERYRIREEDSSSERRRESDRMEEDGNGRG